uniref:CCHC-type domain-containing protein n=1 Tax=Leersia perrieri TaxID=77586 RepID=A0A0D9UZ54_9ORYZ
MSYITTRSLRKPSLTVDPRSVGCGRWTNAGSVCVVPIWFRSQPSPFQIHSPSHPPIPFPSRCCVRRWRQRLGPHRRRPPTTGSPPTASTLRHRRRCCRRDASVNREPSPEIDDELFNEVYGKAYSGPVATTTDNVMPRENDEKKPITLDKSDEEDGLPDPNAVPTDFTSREAKVWEAKAKATERNWKKRKEEEMICKICGESGHFTQGCPSTLGANRRSADFFERVPARDKQVRDLFTERTISQIEKDVGCKIRMDEKFLFVSGKDRLILAKGVEAVHRIIQESKGKNSSRSPKRDRSRSPVRTTTDIRPRHTESRWSHSPRSASLSQSKGYYSERPLDGRSRDDMPKFSKGSPQARASANYGAKGRPAQSKSPCQPSYLDDSLRSNDGNNQYAATYVPNAWSTETRGTDSRLSLKFDLPSYPQTLEELEMEFKREAMELARACDKEEDEENYKHRESLRGIRENHMKRVTAMRSMHARKWDEFLEQSFKRHQQAQQTSYAQTSYPDYDQRTTQFAPSGTAIDSASAYPYSTDSYSAPRPHAGYSEFQHERHDDFGRTYGRY